MNKPFSFEAMNETDVREEIVRPLLHDLGYQRGTENNIRSEVSLRYAKQFLGHRKATDPDLVGRADYICEVIPFARWAVEVKGPGVELSEKDVQQAHTYAAHPEIAALYFLITNGRIFRLYETSKLDAPILEWTHEAMRSRFLEIANVVSPPALKKRSAAIRTEPGKPLGRLLGPRAKIVGGNVTYAEHRSNIPAAAQALQNIKGLRSAVTGRDVFRTDAGLLKVFLTLAGGFEQIDAVNKLCGLEGYDFECADEIISEDPHHPNIFQGRVEALMPAGTEVGPPFVPMKMGLPFAIGMVAYTQAVGFFREDQFLGTFQIRYINEMFAEGEMRAMIERVMPLVQETEADGEFCIVVKA